MSVAVVFQSDFGTKDGAVASMHGVAHKVSPLLMLFNLTHEIPPYNIWEASYRLVQTIQYWPKGTVFVSVVDPGVGSSRRGIVAKTTTGHYIVSPDNGSLTHVKLHIGIDVCHTIDEYKNRLDGSEHSFTFHGRDIFAYTGARLASGLSSLQSIGPSVDPTCIIELPHTIASIKGNTIAGSIDVLDPRFGSLWTNIPFKIFQSMNVHHGQRVFVTICNETREHFKNTIMYGRTFADVHVGEPIVYINSILHVALALNQGAFAQAYNIGTGPAWKIILE